MRLSFAKMNKMTHILLFIDFNIHYNYNVNIPYCTVQSKMLLKMYSLFFSWASSWLPRFNIRLSLPFTWSSYWVASGYIFLSHLKMVWHTEMCPSIIFWPATHWTALWSAIRNIGPAESTRGWASPWLPSGHIWPLWVLSCWSSSSPT